MGYLFNFLFLGIPLFLLIRIVSMTSQSQRRVQELKARSSLQRQNFLDAFKDYVMDLGYEDEGRAFEFLTTDKQKKEAMLGFVLRARTLGYNPTCVQVGETTYFFV